MGLESYEWKLDDALSALAKGLLDKFEQSHDIEEKSDLLYEMIQLLELQALIPICAPVLVRCLLAKVSEVEVALKRTIILVLYCISETYLTKARFDGDINRTNLLTAMQQGFPHYLEMYNNIDTKSWAAGLLALSPENHSKYARNILEDIESCTSNDLRAVLIHQIGRIGHLLPEWHAVLVTLVDDKCLSVRLAAAVEMVYLCGDSVDKKSLSLIRDSRPHDHSVNADVWIPRVIPRISDSVRAEMFSGWLSSAQSSWDASNIVAICFSSAFNKSELIFEVSPATNVAGDHVYTYYLISALDNKSIHFKEEDLVWLKAMSNCKWLRLDDASSNQPYQTNLLGLLGIEMMWVEFLDSIENADFAARWILPKHSETA